MTIKSYLVALLYSLLAGATAFAQAADATQAAIKPSVAALAGVGYMLTWSDEFDGASLDTSKWAYRTDSKWGSTQLPGNVTLGHGVLRLGLTKLDAKDSEGKKFGGAGVISRQAFMYGYYEARLKLSAAAGWHTSFWMTKSDGSGGTSPKVSTQELDVIENDSTHLSSYGVNVHKWVPPHVSYGQKWIKTPDLSQDFHLYGCEFAPKTVKYYFDGKLVQTYDATKFPHGDQNIWLTSIADEPGVNPAQLPDAAEVDYVRFFRKEIK